MSELYTIMQYLRPDLLKKAGISHFDDWCTNYAQVNTQMEMSASGGYKPKKRLNEFVNLPELMQIFHTFADVKNAEDLNLPTPELETGKPIAIVAEPSNFQLEYIQELAERAREVSKGKVDPRQDNLLKITHEARLLGLDGRCIDPTREHSENGKVHLCIDKLMEIYEETADQKGVQAIFSDIAVSSDGDRFSVYEYIKAELIARGIPENEISFAADAKNPEEKTKLMAQLNSGEKRFIIASTQKMGTGCNFQSKLCALHNLDIPYRPSDLSQRNGRIMRQGNSFEKVRNYNYLTEKTFDSYLMGIIVNKAKFINQLLSGKTSGRTCADLGETVLNYAEMQALASGDPRVMEKINLEVDVERLRVLRNSFKEEQYRLEDVVRHNTQELEKYSAMLPRAISDTQKQGLSEGKPIIKIGGEVFEERKDCGEKLDLLIAKLLQQDVGTEMSVGEVGRFGGSGSAFELTLKCLSTMNGKAVEACIKGELIYFCDISENNALGNMTRIENAFENIPKRIDFINQKIERLQHDKDEAQAHLNEEFPKEDEYREKSARLSQLNKIFAAEDNSVIAVPEDEEIAINEDIAVEYSENTDDEDMGYVETPKSL